MVEKSASGNQTQDKPVILIAFANDYGKKIGHLPELAEEMRQLQTLLEGAEKAGLCEFGNCTMAA